MQESMYSMQLSLKEGKKIWIYTQTFVYKWNLSSITKKLVLDFSSL